MEVKMYSGPLCKICSRDCESGEKLCGACKNDLEAEKNILETSAQASQFEKKEERYQQLSLQF